MKPIHVRYIPRPLCELVNGMESIPRGMKFKYRKTLIKLNLHGNSVPLLAIAMPGPNYNLADRHCGCALMNSLNNGHVLKL